MSKKRQNFMRKADALFSKLVRERDGRCLLEGTDDVECKGVLQCAHIVSRSYKSIRCDFDNAVTACQAHHLYYTHHPLEWEEWLEVHLPGRLERLKVEALQYRRVDWKQRYGELKAAAENLELV